MNKNFKFKKININKLNISMLMILFFSTYMVMTSMSWLTTWIFLEMNLMTFIPMMMNKYQLKKSTNGMIKYFIIQSFSSSLMFISIIIMNFFLLNYFKLINMIKIIISLTLLIKLGAAPFHWWMPHVMIKLNWKNCFLLLTWQKFAPLFVIIQINQKNSFMNLCAMMSMIFGAILGLNQTSIKLLLTYSSINHIGWIIINSLMNKMLMTLYLIIYSTMNFIICYLMYFFKINYINQMFKNFNNNKFNMLFLMTMMMSLGGLPPFLGFLPKMFTLILTLKNFMFLESIIMIFTTLITLKFYLNLMLPMMNIYSMKIKFSSSNYYINEVMYSMIINFILSFIIITMMNYLT
uniref:NADH-ubiquinone oxidoreductase chain 2 n=1 Tax=Arge aurora TaxID=2728854 RepID=A0A6M5U9N3_9HYME|nr:NADH dehydrogenase subunit 2 [Arge aurora]